MIRPAFLSRLASHAIAIAAVSTALVPATLQAQPPRPNFQITQIKDNLYRSGNGAWHSIFLVTDEGILLADPLNVAHATWLKNELASRFDKPVKYVVYSHSHWDHVEGAALFKDTATIIAYEGMFG